MHRLSSGKNFIGKIPPVKHTLHKKKDPLADARVPRNVRRTISFNSARGVCSPFDSCVRSVRIKRRIKPREVKCDQ